MHNVPGRGRASGGEPGTGKFAEASGGCVAAWRVAAKQARANLSKLEVAGSRLGGWR